jgi:hypothetical protein
MWHILYRKLLLLLMIGNRFLKTVSSSSSISVIEEPIIGIVVIGTGESIISSTMTLYYGCNNSRYREKRLCDHQSGHIYPLLLKSYFSEYRAPPNHLILLKDSVSRFYILSVSIGTVEMEPLRIVWIVNEMVTHSLMVQLPNTWVKQFSLSRTAPYM